MYVPHAELGGGAVTPGVRRRSGFRAVFGVIEGFGAPIGAWVVVIHFVHFCNCACYVFYFTSLQPGSSYVHFVGRPKVRRQITKINIMYFRKPQKRKKMKHLGNQYCPELCSKNKHMCFKREKLHKQYRPRQPWLEGKVDDHRQRTCGRARYSLNTDRTTVL